MAILRNNMLDTSTSNTFTVKNLISNDLNYPLVDGASGNVIMTDGGGNLTLQAIPAPPPAFYITTTPVTFNSAAITMTSTFLQYRIISNNAGGPCTWTMDTGGNLSAGLPATVANDSFSVFVNNLTGATITIAANTGITVIGVPNTSTSFSFWLENTGVGFWNVFY